MTLDFVEAMRPERIVVIDPGNPPAADLPRLRDRNPIVIQRHAWRKNPTLIADTIRGFRTVIGFETWYSRCFHRVARELGVRSVLLPMWECSPRNETADHYVNVTDQDQFFYPAGVRQDWPVADSCVRTRRTEWPPRRFVHLAGNGGSHARNNTHFVMEAAKYLEGTGAELVVRSQDPKPFEGRGVTVEGEIADRADLFDGMDVLVFPTGIQGLALPLNEAAANCIPCIVPDLPQWRDWPYRVPVHRYDRVKVALRFEMARPNVEGLGALMRRMALGLEPRKLPPAGGTWRVFREWWAGQSFGGRK